MIDVFDALDAVDTIVFCKNTFLTDKTFN